MAAITKYVSDIDSSKQFDTLEDQLAFDASKRHEAAINAFLDRHYPVDPAAAKQGPARAIVAKGLAKYLAEQDAAA